MSVDSHTQKFPFGFFLLCVLTISAKGAYASPFTFSNRAWGYTDILNVPWNDFLAPDCIYNNNDSLDVKVRELRVNSPFLCIFILFNLI